MKKSAAYGFTIVELLIVVVVIAILAAITIVSYNGIQQQARLTQHIAALSQYGKQYQSYIALKGESPYVQSLGTGTGNRYGCISPKTNCYTEWDAAVSAELQSRMAEISKSDPSFVWLAAIGVRSGVEYLFTRFPAGTQSCPAVSGLADWESEVIPSSGQLHCRYQLRQA